MARKQKDDRRVWRLTRTLGGTGRRERKRNTKDVRADDPTPTEWSAAMRQRGGDGGCEAEEVRIVPEGEIYDRKEVLRIDMGSVQHNGEALADPETVLEVIQKMRYMRCVPEGRARKELYQMAMEYDPLMKRFWTGVLNQAWQQACTLGTWELADAASG